MKKFKLTIILCLIMVMFCPMFFTACTGGMGSFGSNGGGSGSGSGSGSGGSGSGGSGDVTNKDYGSPSSTDIDDYFESVLILTDATPEGEFYDEISQSNMTFKDLLRRQITAFSEHLVFALKAIYGDGDMKTGSTVLTGYSIMLQAANVLGSSHMNECGYSSSSKFNINCPKCQSLIAGLGSTPSCNQLNYMNAINGGYVYEVKPYENKEENKEQTGAFSTIVNSEYAWLSPMALTTDNLKLEISKILVSEGEPSDVFDNNLKLIDHLGFTNYDIEQIKKYIFEKIIGLAIVNKDNELYESYFKNNSLVSNTTDDVDQFPFNLNLHYFRAYEINVNAIIEVALTMSTDGVQHVDKDGNYNGNNSTRFKLYPDMLPRINVEVLKLRQISDKINGVWDEETGKIVGGSVDGNQTPVLDDSKKLVSLIFIPKMNQDMIDDFRDGLEDTYGSNVANSYNCEEFGLGSFNIGLKNASSSSSVVVKLKHNISITGLEEEFNQYVANSVFNEEKSSDVFISENEIKLEKDKYDPEVYLACYDISSALEEKYSKKVKISDFNGLEIFKNNKLNDDFFHYDNWFDDLFNINATLKVQSSVFSVTGKTDENGKAIPGTNAVFNADSNFLQVNFEYYNDSNEAIAPVELYLMYLSIWPD